MSYDPADLPPRTGSNLPEMSVGDLARALKRTVEDAYGYVRVRGEISQPKRHSSGHVYLRLKDETAVLEAVCWKGVAARLSVRPEEGMEVVCTGRLTTYPGRSQYQLVIETMELAGEGALLKMLEERKRRLAAEGLFAPERKKPLPFLPEVIGVVTSPTGAVIRDILHRLADRFPRHVLLWPVAVQGEGAADQVARAIAGFNAIAPGGPVPRPDLIIVARGGGSLEDLMPFNEEAVVRAAAASAIPLISAVGHETDTTLIDFASDRRAPTPTAAAEMAVPVRTELLAQVLDDGRRLHQCLSRAIDTRRSHVEGLGRGLGDPRALLEGCIQRLDDRAERLELSLRTGLERRHAAVQQLGIRLRHPREVIGLAAARADAAGRALRAGFDRAVTVEQGRFHRVADRLSPLPLRRQIDAGRDRLDALPPRLAQAHARRLDQAGQRLVALGQLLESYSYKGVLERGFVLVADAEGRPVTRAADTAPGQPVALRFADGTVGAVVDGAAPGASPAARTRAGKAKADQGSLF
ncbi:exodeoxyribonuclease VII large subunit [Rhodospirillum centenum]|uniref:Exodeoxyribonuclease 7 large subunit n=1 Tax=Rhodospirillum centenum (strain ATCC 51521 / SW) TaxID=414684 RepID=EX7L_RHOCS|nr:exodeoxyribonuclease VII large subunit [Rhodospirillum centenum]B6IXD4.1 RecName: Full=Exodeoxyribonuclease 7 large subunit; AltName: Full=Exodeoxyribonuclease VII large subunit; Short=Exonuclease VII large subunit [Rhodospirillum centenum SW]ACJ00958.1 exodeoxyribonuclease VII, large subunit, putative [Rhodospirillum centenum SW]